eukprot:1916136-Rhodomonas_salina.1
MLSAYGCYGPAYALCAVLAVPMLLRVSQPAVLPLKLRILPALSTNNTAAVLTDTTSAFPTSYTAVILTLLLH